MKSFVGLLSSVVKPIHLLLTALAYLLGISIAKYLGITINSAASIFGGAYVILVLAASFSLDMYFSPSYRIPPVIENPKEREAFRRSTLYLSIVLLALATVFVFMLLVSDYLNFYAVTIILLYLLLALIYAIPPIRLIERGFGELVMAFLISGFPVLLAFTLQAMNFHRLVTYFDFPVIFISLACLLALNFPSYAVDQKFGYQTLLVRLTWEHAVPIHNLLLIISYIMFSAAPLFGIPFRLIWPVMLTLPLAIYQVVMLRNIMLGLKPNWRVLTINAMALWGIVIYLLMFTFWVR
jgi:1,4-dihydroxy-2-naphthoate octaprenyltransferase